MFLIFLQAVSGETQTASEVVSQLAQLTLGGPACGLAAGIALYFGLRPAFLDPVLESGVILASFWLLYYVADEVFGVSSVLAITTFGIFFAWKGRDMIDQESYKHHTAVLTQVGYISNTLIFVIAGAIIFNVFSGTFGNRAVDITEFVSLSPFIRRHWIGKIGDYCLRCTSC
jgi:NhaP-type Na+/H+ or K+/H+ antiporter